MTILKYYSTARMALREKTNGGVAYLLADSGVRVLWLVPLMFIWKTLTAGGYEVEMSIGQLMTYTWVNAILAELMVVSTCLSTWNYSTRSMELFTRPMPLFGQIIARTLGEWTPGLLLFSLPMALIAPLLGIRMIPATGWVWLSLLLGVSLGFAFEFLFFCVTVRARSSWMSYVIRQAVVSMLSGTVIPFALMPWGLERWLQYQPFGSMGGAFLSLYVGNAAPAQVIPAQIVWNVVIWTAAAVWFEKSRERMVSFGG